MSRRRILVVGGGITGLAAAHRCTEHGADVVLCDAAERLGGIISTERTDGWVMERGSDSFITDKPWAMALCERIGIAGELIGTQPGERRTHVVHGGRLHALPEGFLLLAPTALWPLAVSPLFSLRGKLRMLADFWLPARTATGDESLAAFVRRRLGDEALERVADALVGGIYTADPEQLSLAATMPRFLELERRYGSIIRGLRATRAAQPGSAGARYGLFVAHRDGMQGLVDGIAARLAAGSVRLGTRIVALATAGGTWRATTAAGERIDADAAIVTLPAPVTAALLAPVDDELARLLARIEYASSATVTLGFRASDVAGRLHGFGFVVPFAEHRDLIAATFSSRKYAGRAPAGHELVRAFVGGARRPDLVERGDDELVRIVRGELRGLLGVAGAPVLVRVQRWRAAMPQYRVGHLDHVAAIEGRVTLHPGLAVAGAAYRGVGIPDCVRGGEAAADAVAYRMTQHAQAS